MTLKDEDGLTLFTRSALTEETTYQDYYDRTALAETVAVYVPLQIPVAGNHTVTVDCVAPQLGNRTFTTRLLLERIER